MDSRFHGNDTSGFHTRNKSNKKPETNKMFRALIKSQLWISAFAGMTN